jgi:hypothetical protein
MLASILTSSDVYAASLAHWPAFPFSADTGLADTAMCRAWSIPSPPDEMDLAPANVFQVYHLVRQGGGVWVTFAVFNDAPLVVEFRPHLFELELEDGGRVSSSQAFASTPAEGYTMAPIRLQGPYNGAAVLSVGAVWRKPYHGGDPATVVFALFPFSRDSSSTPNKKSERPWRLEDVVRVRTITSP